MVVLAVMVALSHRMLSVIFCYPSLVSLCIDCLPYFLFEELQKELFCGATQHACMPWSCFSVQTDCFLLEKTIAFCYFSASIAFSAQFVKKAVFCCNPALSLYMHFWEKF